MSVSRLISETSKLCSNLCFLPGFHFFELFLEAAGCKVAAALLRSPPSILHVLFFPLAIYRIWPRIPLSFSAKFIIFANSAGLLYFSIILFSPFDKIQILYNYIIHVLSILTVWLRIVGTSCFLLFAWGRACENRPSRSGFFDPLLAWGWAWKNRPFLGRANLSNLLLCYIWDILSNSFFYQTPSYER